jgi:hypothetical protein
MDELPRDVSQSENWIVNDLDKNISNSNQSIYKDAMRLGGSVMLLVNRYRNKDKINLFRGFTLWK